MAEEREIPINKGNYSMDTEERNLLLKKTGDLIGQRNTKFIEINGLNSQKKKLFLTTLFL